MNLDEMLAASGITGGAAADGKNVKSGFVTLIGRPNVGKSTLMNRMIGQKIAITSNKPQTTRNRIQTVHTDERGQIVFVDTPGIHKAKINLVNIWLEQQKRQSAKLMLYAGLLSRQHISVRENSILLKDLKK